MNKLAHIGMVVNDCERSGLFYCKALGCKKLGEFQDDKMKFIYLTLGDQIIELIQYLGGEGNLRLPGPIDHIAIEVSDIYAEVARLKNMEIEFLSDSPREVLGGRKIIFLLGPDGERIELVQQS